jgi:fatty-acid desaturase
LFWALFSGFGIAIGYHRLLSHRAFVTSRFWERTLASFGILAGEGSPVSWVATHRGLHHPFADQEKDPHSPRHGFFHAYMGWQISVTKEDVNPRHAIDVVRDPFLRFISMRYYLVYWTVLAVFFAVSWRLALFAVVPAMVISLHQENIINSICHMPRFGYRNFNLKDDSTNIWPLGILFWGQGFHNNHHRFPRSYNFGVHWWEIDVCRWVVWLIRTDRQKAVNPSPSLASNES